MTGLVQVQLDLSNPQSHLVHVRLEISSPQAQQQVSLPGWTPGSYLIRDYVKQLEGFKAVQQDLERSVRRSDPSTWQIDCDPSAGPLALTYSVMATELTVRTCHLDQDHGFFALAALVLEVAGQRWSPHRLTCVLPNGWNAFVPLPREATGSWLATTFDQLIDSPIEAGPHQSHPFEVLGVPHRWVTWFSDPACAAWFAARYPTFFEDVQQVCLACCRLMGEPRPASSDYLFVLHLLDEGYGGLEHDDSTVLVYGRRNLETSSGYRKLLQLVAHEYFHQWNVRRLTPRELRPVEYKRASVIPTLWFAEGVTSYFDQLLPLTAGLSTPQDYFSDLGEDLSRYMLTPGRQVQTLRESSEEAWVKLYKADAYSASSQVSYYLKGAVVALCLDLELRRHQSSLSAVVQQLWRSHGRHGRGYGESDLLEAFERQVAGLAGHLEQWLTDVDDPDCSGYLLDVGLALEPEMSSAPWTGMTTGLKDGRLVVQRVLRHSPAERAGLMVGDELIGLAGQRLAKPEDVSTYLRAGVAQPLLMARRSSLRELELCSDPPQPKRYKLEPVANPTPAQQAAQEAWLQQRVG